MIEPNLQRFVYDMFQAHNRAETKDVICRIPLLAPEVPQQENDVDCARVVLCFIKQFLDHAPDDSNKSSLMSTLTKFTPDAFSPEYLAKFCDNLVEDEKLLWHPIAEPTTRKSQRIRNARLRQRKPSVQGAPETVIIEDDSDKSS
ncbi:unnamed protein product [Amaranthus hypochondriacus]